MDMFCEVKYSWGKGLDSEGGDTVFYGVIREGLLGRALEEVGEQAGGHVGG